jgi:hypothetical protein
VDTFRTLCFGPCLYIPARAARKFVESEFGGEAVEVLQTFEAAKAAIKILFLNSFPFSHP